jgi:hypothetical protein
MSIALPTLRGTAQQALYPFTRTIKFNTLVSVNQDGSQQRSILDNPRVLFDLPFTRLNPADKDSVKAFAASSVGQYATNLSLTLGNVTYTNLSLDSDLYSGKVRAATMWDSGLKLTQTQAQNLRPTTTLTAAITTTTATSIQVASVAGFNGYITIGTETMLVTWTPDSTHFTVARGQLGTTAATHSNGATVSWGPAFSLGQAYPALPNGTRTQIPWQQNQQYKTEVSQMDAGPKYTYAWYGGHLTNFPTEGLRQWVVGGDMLTDADVALLEAHFLANWGRFAAWTFTDPETGTTYSNSYYTTDEMVIEYIEPNVNRVSMSVEAYNQGSGILSATISYVTTHIPGTGYTGTASVSMGTGYTLFDSSSYTSRTDTTTWTSSSGHWGAPVGPLVTTTNPLNSAVGFFVEGTLSGSASPPDIMRIYDCYMDVTYSDSTTARFRPSVATATAGQGTVTNPQNAIDGNLTTYCEIARSSFGPTANIFSLAVSHWVLSV